MVTEAEARVQAQREVCAQTECVPDPAFVELQSRMHTLVASLATIVGQAELPEAAIVDTVAARFSTLQFACEEADRLHELRVSEIHAEAISLVCFLCSSWYVCTHR